MADSTTLAHDTLEDEIKAYMNSIKAKVYNEEFTVFDLFSLYISLDSDFIDYKFEDIKNKSYSLMNNMKRYLRKKFRKMVNIIKIFHLKYTTL